MSDIVYRDTLIAYHAGKEYLCGVVPVSGSKQPQSPRSMFLERQNGFLVSE